MLIVVVAVSGAVAYYVITAPSACNFQTTNPLIFDQPERPDSLDPHVTFSTPGWGVVQQVYQSMVNYNGSQYTRFVPVLASSWTNSTDGFNWTFHLRQDVHFSNGDAFNAYVMWYSLYRALVMNQAGSFILQENFWYPGVNYYSASAASNSSRDWVASVLNSYNFVNPTSAQLAVMEASNQSFQVIDKYTIQLNLGAGYLGVVPYTYLLASLSGPIASAVDPLIVSANGGVPVNDYNRWMATHTVGTGPFVLRGGFLDLGSATKYTLDPDPSYWAMNDSKAEPWNDILAPAKSSLEIDFQGDPAIAVNDMKTGRVLSASLAYIGPSTINSLKGLACINVNALDDVYGSTAGAWWVYMNQNTAPFNNLSVRKAVVHAINYDRIIQVAFGGYAKRWVGPVPLGYPDYNLDNLAPYEYNLTLAKQYMNQSP
ncbi:MAG TPA: ABC transporter substrate-binding protein [Thermoplasmata archaeon]|nr:ABC transporter substrate-binding protein [Thermoplasmata archaeon]